MTAARNRCVSSRTLAGLLSGADPSKLAPLRRKAFLPDNTHLASDLFRPNRTHPHCAPPSRFCRLCQSVYLFPRSEPRRAGKWNKARLGSPLLFCDTVSTHYIVLIRTMSTLFQHVQHIIFCCPKRAPLQTEQLTESSAQYRPKYRLRHSAGSARVVPPYEKFIANHYRLQFPPSRGAAWASDLFVGRPRSFTSKAICKKQELDRVTQGGPAPEPRFSDPLLVAPFSRGPVKNLFIIFRCSESLGVCPFQNKR